MRMMSSTRPLAESAVEEPVEGKPRQGEQRVPGVDGERDAPDRPQRGPVAALQVAVLDVVVDEAEVVAELHCGGAGQRALVLAGDRAVGEQAEQGPDALAARALALVEAEVVGELS